MLNVYCFRLFDVIFYKYIKVFSIYDVLRVCDMIQVFSKLNFDVVIFVEKF